MNAVKINKTDLLRKIIQNRNEHKILYHEAHVNFRKKAVQALTRMLAKAKAGGEIELAINLPKPSDHTEEYDRVIAMLKMSVDEVIELDEEQFAQYVLDRWSWRRQWIASNSSYSSKISKMSA